MRETLLHAFAAAGAAPAGATRRVAWRVEPDARALLFAPLAAGAARPVRVPLAAAPAAPPVVVDARGAAAGAVAYVVVDAALLRVEVDVAAGLARAVDEVRLPGACGAVTSVGEMPAVAAEERVALGFETGDVACARFGGGRPPSLEVFGGDDGAGDEEPDPVPIDADNTSVVSAASTAGPDAAAGPAGSGDRGSDAGESVASTRSYRSTASSLSRRFFGAGLFGAAGPAAAPAAPRRIAGAGGAGASAAAASRRNRGAPADAVVALAALQLSVPVVAALHASGTVAAYAPAADGAHRFAGKMRLPVPLAAGAAAGHFLLAGDADAGVLLAVVTVDHDPRPHALHVFSIAVTMRITRRVAFASTVVAQRTGPFDRIAGAAVAPTAGGTPAGASAGAAAGAGMAAGAVAPAALVLATVSGDVVSIDLVPAPSAEPSGAGLPLGTVWSALDDMREEYGSWQVFDSVREPAAACDRLLAARRFSSAAIAKALRAPEVSEAARSDLVQVCENLVRHAVEAGEDEPAIGDRLVERARRHGALIDMPVSRVQLVSGVGVVVSRNSGLFVVRPFLAAEIRCAREQDALSLSALGADSILKTILVPTADAHVARILAAHAAPQLAAAQFLLLPREETRNEAEAESRERAGCVLSLSLRVAESGNGFQSLGEVSSLAIGVVAPSLSSENADVLSWEDAVSSAATSLSPSKRALLLLRDAGEFAALEDLVARCADTLPMSSLYCQGIVLLEACKRAKSTEGDSIMYTQDEGEAASGADNEASGNAHSALIERAFGAFVSASKIAGMSARRQSEATEAEWDDVDCAIELSQLDQLRLEAGSKDDAIQVEESPPRNGVPRKRSRAAWAHLDFWLLERSLRLIEGAGYADVAAAIALQALESAPDAKSYEMMRAAAFGRFLDAANLECALTTILKSPFSVCGADVGDAVSAESAHALRDCIGLLVNAAIDGGRFSWLLGCDLPVPIKELAALALERRARSSETFMRDDLLKEMDSVDDPSENQLPRSSSPYEFLYVWQLARQDFVGAAVCAVEWYERVASEGLSETVAFVASSRLLEMHSPLSPLLTWARIKSRALSAACAAVRSLPENEQYVPRTRHSILAGYSPIGSTGGVVDLSWLSRRLLLARAQMIFLRKRIGLGAESTSKSSPSSMPSSDYVVSQADILLSDRSRGVGFALSSLLIAPTSVEATFQALDLALVWRVEDCEDSLLSGVVSMAGVRASGSNLGKTSEVSILSYADLSKLLEHVTLATKAGGRCTSRNWYLVAAEGVLDACAGTMGLPQWLSDAASYGPGVGAEARAFGSGKLGGDACGMIRLWLRYGRLAEAAEMLIDGLNESIALLRRQEAATVQIDIPYSCIDSALELLTDNIEAERASVVERQYYDELRNLAISLAELTG